MSDKTFIKALIITLAVCIGLTAAHLIYIMHAYENSSIIYFISHEESSYPYIYSGILHSN